MRFLIWFVFVFSTASLLAILAHLNEGNVTFFITAYRIDLSLNMFLLFLLFLFILFYFLLRLLANARQFPKWLTNYRERKEVSNANQALRNAVRFFYEGRFVNAEKEAKRATSFDENKGVAALIGARAAQAMFEYERRDQWLNGIAKFELYTPAYLASRLELDVDAHQVERIEVSLDAVNESGAKHIHIQRLSLQANLQKENWQEVLRITQSLENHQAIRVELARDLRAKAYINIFDPNKQTVPAIRLAWLALSDEQRAESDFVQLVCRALYAHGLSFEAHKIVRDALINHWDNRLLALYRFTSEQSNNDALIAQVKQCEKWMIDHPDNAELALTLGYLCFKQRLWGMAKKHLTRALDVSTEESHFAETHFYLAELHTALQEEGQANAHYKLSATYAAQTHRNFE